MSKRVNYRLPEAVLETLQAVRERFGLPNDTAAIIFCVQRAFDVGWPDARPPIAPRSLAPKPVHTEPVHTPESRPEPVHTGKPFGGMLLKPKDQRK